MMHGEPHSEINEFLEGLINDDRVVKNVAKLHKKFFDELICVGFSEDQTIQILTSRELVPIK